MEQKQNQTEEKAALLQKGNNKALFWILGGCLVLLLVAAAVTAGIMYLSYKKIKKEIQQNPPKIEQPQNQAEKPKEAAQKNVEPVQTPVPEPPQAISEEPTANPETAQNAEGAMPFVGEKQIGYVKKVYTKAGKNYLSIDYIQWLTGAEAEKAMREDGQCPKTGECIVMDDYYIRNQNPLIRTFEVVPTAEITMQTYDMEETGLIHPQKISFAQFSWIFAPKVNSRLKDVPYIVEIGSNKITKINEQYIP